MSRRYLTVLERRLMVDRANTHQTKNRTLNALKEAGKTALEEAIDHPVAKVLVAGLEGFME